MKVACKMLVTVVYVPNKWYTYTFLQRIYLIESKYVIRLLLLYLVIVA